MLEYIWSGTTEKSPTNSLKKKEKSNFFMPYRAERKENEKERDGKNADYDDRIHSGRLPHGGLLSSPGIRDDH